MSPTFSDILAARLAPDDFPQQSWSLGKRKLSEISISYSVKDLNATRFKAPKIEAACPIRTELDIEETYLIGLGFVLAQWAAIVLKGEPASFDKAEPSLVASMERLKQVHKHYRCSDACFVVALVYMQRACVANPTLSRISPHHMYNVAVMLAAKLHDDVYYNNSYYARICGLSLMELNTLEAKMLKMLDWKTFVSREEYQHYHELVISVCEIQDLMAFDQ